MNCIVTIMHNILHHATGQQLHCDDARQAGPHLVLLPGGAEPPEVHLHGRRRSPSTEDVPPEAA